MMCVIQTTTRFLLKFMVFNSLNNYILNIKGDFVFSFADTDEHFINLTEENDKFVIDTVVGEDPSVQWIINVDAHPIPNLEWYLYNL